MIGIVLREGSIPRLLDQVAQAEALGIPAVWLTTSGAGRDALTVFAAAALRTATVRLGASILPTWPRHPIAVVQQAQVIAALAPGRLRIGLGVANQSIEQLLGLDWRAPLDHLREYVQVLKVLLQSGAVDFEGKWFTARAKIEAPVDVPILTAALRRSAYRLAGEVSDGAISWMTPLKHVRRVSLPAIREGSEKVGRPPPPLILHVPFCLSPLVDRVREATRQQVGFYARLSTYAAMFEEAGYAGLNGELSDELIEDLVVYGEPGTVAQRLSELPGDGIGEVIGHALTLPGADQQTIFEVIAEASKLAKAKSADL